MDRRIFLGSVALAVSGPVLTRFGGSKPGVIPPSRASASWGRNPDWEPLKKPKEEWRQILSPSEFEILRDAGTERAGSSPLNAEKRPGMFICAGCFLPLFSSDDKFMSGTGWPSFTSPMMEENVDTKLDFKMILPRREYHCARCEGHQGHIFKDGPPPTGERWCNNGAALDFVPDGDPLPELRT